MVAIVMSLLVALSSHGAATTNHAATSQKTASAVRSTNFPIRGVVVAGKSIGTITLGMTQAQVRAHWGRSYEVCSFCKKTVTWFYEYKGGEPLGAAVKFLKGKVVSVFTLGSPAGWGLKGLMMGDPVTNVYNLFGNTGSAQCIGYDALTVKIGASTMSFYAAAGVIYGYALTGPSESVCQ
ncbi:MAG TPA: hypothetical protein VGM80_08115 [Gaiellaceae bacterium]